MRWAGLGLEGWVWVGLRDRAGGVLWFLAWEGVGGLPSDGWVVLGISARSLVLFYSFLMHGYGSVW
jgi:hypothetical protein